MHFKNKAIRAKTVWGILQNCWPGATAKWNRPFHCRRSGIRTGVNDKMCPGFVHAGSLTWLNGTFGGAEPSLTKFVSPALLQLGQVKMSAVKKGPFSSPADASSNWQRNIYILKIELLNHTRRAVRKIWYCQFSGYCCNCDFLFSIFSFFLEETVYGQV